MRGVDDARLAWVASGGQSVDCPANIYMNGSPARTDLMEEPPEFDVLAANFSVIGVEIYAGPATPVADSLGCGVILLWSRADESVVDEELVGSIEGVVVWPESVELDRRAMFFRDQGFQVLLEPGGRRGSLIFGRFGIPRILPGRYRLEVQRDGLRVWAESVTVVANATANVRVELSSR